MFHANDGWFFKRNDDESVTIAISGLYFCRECGAKWRKWQNDGGWSLASSAEKPLKCCDNAEMKEQTILPIVPSQCKTFDANTWASIIASSSKEGEENYRFYLAQKFHNGGMKKCSHILGEKFAGAGHPCGLFFDTHYMLDADHKFEP